jgi:DNA polymerase
MTHGRDADTEAASSADETGTELPAGSVQEATGTYTSAAPPAIEPATSKTARLAVVAAAASVCTACGLARTRTKVVFGEGNPEAPLMLIGEGPGQNEDSTGRPFVGRAGVLLDACLRENGITRKHIYITNVVRCRPTLVEAGTVKNRPPTPEEVRACANWLEQTIEIVQPLVILCLGAPAANSIIHKGFRMTQERGQWFESKYVRYAMAAWHPAYILRLEGEAYDAARRSLVNDIATARQKVIEAKREPKRTLF